MIAASDRRRRAVVTRPLLTSKASGARLSVSGGGRHVARREGDKCASYGSLFIGQSSGTQVETEEESMTGLSQALRTPVKSALPPTLVTRFATKKSACAKRGYAGGKRILAGLLMFS